VRRAAFSPIRESPAPVLGGPRGFTLMEVLVAVGLLAMLSALMYQGLVLSFRARERIARVEELNHGARMALRRIVADLSMAFVSNHMNREEPATTTLFLGQSDGLTFTYLGHERRRRGSRESDQGVVEYRLGRDEGGLTIQRREKPLLDTDPEKGGTVETLVTGVQEFRVRYWDSKAEDWKDDWKVRMEDALKAGKAGDAGKYAPVLTPTGSALQKASQQKMLEEYRLPERVYLRLVLVDEEGNRFPFETEARVHLVFPLAY